MATAPAPTYRVPFCGVGERYTDADKKAVLEAMDVTSTLTQGNYQKEFEKVFSDYLNGMTCFATSSCATAIELVALVLRLQPGDEIICPAHTYCASVYPFARHGVSIKWADIDPDTLVVSADTIRPLISEKTKAIVVVHLYGLPANMPEIMALASSKNIPVMEDCAQAMGATINGQTAGTFGDFSVFSFQSHKNISTLGEGGILAVKNENYSKILPGLRHNGHHPFPAGREQYWVPAMVNVDTDIDGVWPHNFCMGEVQCALGIELMKRIDEIRKTRKARHLHFVDAMKAYPELVFQKIPAGFESAHHLLPFRVESPNFTNHNFIAHMNAHFQVQPIVQYYPLYRYPLFSKMGHGHADVPHTDRFFDNMVSVPFHRWMSEDDFAYMIQSTQKTVEALR